MELGSSTRAATIGVALDVSEQIETTERLQDAIRGGELGGLQRKRALSTCR